MTLHIRSALRDGLAHALTRNGLVLTGVYLLAATFQMGLIYVVGTTYVPPSPETVAAPGGGSAPAPGSTLPPVVSALATGLGSLTGGLLTIPIAIVGIRTFVSDRRDSIPDEFVFHRLVRASFTAFGAGMVVTLAMFVAIVLPLILAGVGVAALPDPATAWILTTWSGRAAGVLALLALLVPTAALYASLLFVTHEVAVRDRRLVGALRGSWATASGNRLRLLGLYTVLVVPQMAVFGLLSAQAPPSLEQAAVTLVTAPLSILVMSVIARAYVQLRDDAPDALPRPTERL